MIILGVLAVVAPAVATNRRRHLRGLALLLSGIIGLVAMFSAKNIPAFLWSLLTAALSAAVGVLLVWKPIAGALSLTLVLTAFFIVGGVFQLVTSVAYRDAIRGSWWWMMVSGIADLALAAIIMLGWPMTAVWALGLIVGINLITYGWAIVMAALGGRSVAQAALAPTGVRH